MRRSFRNQLALRATLSVVLGLGAITAFTVLSLRSFLDDELNSSILNVASIQAASLTEAASGEMHFHEWELTPDEAASLRDLIRYAQVWQADGISLLRSQFMTSDLPLDSLHLAKAGDGELVWAERSWDGLPIRTLYYPLERFGSAHERHVLQIAAPLTARNAMLLRVGLFMTLLSAMLGAVTFAGAYWLAGRAVRPVHEVIEQAEEIRAGSLGHRIKAYAEVQEYHRLVQVLNTMLERIEGAFEAQRRFTSDASHELRSPLTAMRGELELALRRERQPDEYRAVLASTLEEVVRLSRITEDLLVLARSDSGALSPRLADVDVAEVVGHVTERLRTMAEERGLTLTLGADGSTTARVDSGMVGQVAWNLIENAIKFTGAGGRVDVSVAGDGAEVTISVRDSGPGFSLPEQAFRRFFREDQARTRGTESDGTGLGLAIVQAVAEAHGGSVVAENIPEGGARVAVRLPVDAPAP